MNLSIVTMRTNREDMYHQAVYSFDKQFMLGNVGDNTVASEILDTFAAIQVRTGDLITEQTM
jgi:hypothetical protein